MKISTTLELTKYILMILTSLPIIIFYNTNNILIRILIALFSILGWFVAFTVIVKLIKKDNILLSMF